MDKDVLWWEKTVEYVFVLRHLGTDAVMPFAGKPEQAWGDLLVKGGLGNLCLIEFKRAKVSIRSEYEKYPDFLDPEETTQSRKVVLPELLTKDFREAYLELLIQRSTANLDYEQAERIVQFAKGGHRIVYGVANQSSIDLRAVAYAGIRDEMIVPTGPTTSWGYDSQIVAEYLRVLAELRDCWTDGEQGETGSTAMGMVMGLVASKSVAIPAADFLRLAINHQLVPAPTPASSPPNEPSYPQPSF